jgi:hypothetical protein
MKIRSALYQELFAAIFNPSISQGEQGDRTLTEWQADSVVASLHKFYPHIEQVYAGHLDILQSDPTTYSVADDIKRLAELITSQDSLEEIDQDQLATTLTEIGHQVSRELSHRDALLDTAIRVQGAVIQLLNSNDVFIGTHWIKDIQAESRLGQPALFAHVWSYTADTEEIPAEKLLFIADLLRRFGPHAIQAWVCHVRGWNKPMKGDLSIEGIAALKYLNSLEHEAHSFYRENAFSDNSSENISKSADEETTVISSDTDTNISE